MQNVIATRSDVCARALTYSCSGYTHADIEAASLEDLTAAADIGDVNLACEVGLPGAEELDISDCLRTLDQWAGSVHRYTDACLGKASRDGEGSQAWPVFAFLCLVTLIKRGLGVSYQPSAIGNFVFADSRDDFLHGPLTRRLGTCASLPVLFTAIGRRLGYPMYLAIAKSHVLCQWVEPNGTSYNLEGSCLGGGNCHPDEHYHEWPYRLTTEELASGCFLRPLSPAEELALFLETRGHCLADTGRRAEARAAYEAAGRVAPGWSNYRNHLVNLEYR